MMKNILKISAIAAVILSVLSSCSKDIDRSLLGQWEGVCTALTPSRQVTLTFTEKNFTLTMDGENRLNTPYTCNITSDGERYISLAESGGGGEAIYYVVNGKTLSITGGNGTNILMFPKTLTKK